MSWRAGNGNWLSLCIFRPLIGKPNRVGVTIGIPINASLDLRHPLGEVTAKSLVASELVEPRMKVWIDAA